MDRSPAEISVGITALLQHSVFSNGSSTCALSLGSALTKMGQNVTLVNMANGSAWFDDCKLLQGEQKIRGIAECADGEFDLLIDVDGQLIPAERGRIGKKVAVFLRKNAFFHDMESCIQPIQVPVRNFDGVSAIWTWRHQGAENERQLNFLTGLPVCLLDQTWNPKIIARQAEESGWGEQPTVHNESEKEGVWTIRIAENNHSVASSVVLPLTIASQIKSTGAIPQEDVQLYNSQPFEKNEQFNKNILEHCKQPDMKVHQVGRQRFTDWRVFPKTLVICHNRFMTMKTALLDLAWNGIPFIHNSPWMRDAGWAEGYQTDNSITEATEAAQRVCRSADSHTGVFSLEGLAAARGRLVGLVEAKQEEWKQAIRVALREESGMGGAVGGAVSGAAGAPAEKTVLRVGYSDLWAAARVDVSFFTLLLKEAAKYLKTPLRIEPIEITDANLNTPIDILFQGVFGETWKKVSAAVPKIHFTGENTRPKSGNHTVLNIGFDHSQDTNQIRLPLWMQYINWFGHTNLEEQNPKQLPVDRMCHVGSGGRKKFCAFIVSNPTNNIRNEAFLALSQQKRVDSAGRCFNNVGESIFTQIAGGGGGELKKQKFLMDQKFCLAQENSKHPGQITEKWLAAKAAGAIPIQWGADDITGEFDPRGFINANDCKTAQELIDKVQAIDTNDAAYEAMRSVPALDKERFERCRQLLRNTAAKILAVGLGRSMEDELPAVLGCEWPVGLAEGEGGVSAVVGEGGVAEVGGAVASYKADDTVMVTCATARFVPSLLRWIESATTMAKASPTLRIRIQLGADVDEATYKEMQGDYPSIEFKRLPTVAPPGFAEFWEPQHQAWKLWIYADLVKDAALNGATVWYMDAASIIVRWPFQFIAKAQLEGVCFLEDRTQINKNWCHKEFCAALQVTEAELAAHQILGGIVAFKSGHPAAKKIFEEALQWAQKREVIVGKKWEGIGADGKPFGHRHDQSILSILRLRAGAAVEPFDTVQCDESLRRTFKTGTCLYVHRGQFKLHKDFQERIGEAHIISLARRKDRIQKFKENHGAWTKEVCLRPAFDGKALQLTPQLFRLFAPNDFFWKKAVMGCALSHLSLWIELAGERAECENQLVMEDDVKLAPNWLETWGQAAKTIPEDQDVLQLGGVLPPNRAVFGGVLEPVAPQWCRVAPNSIFGQKPPTSQFHFCNQAQVLSRRGAQKILEIIRGHGGFYTSADHMICNQVNDLKHQVMVPQVAGCQQDDDPKQQNSSFNNFSRIDSFDSDLWNNDERFTKEEVDRCGDLSLELNLTEAVQGALDATLVGAAEAVEAAGPVEPVFQTVGDFRIDPSKLQEQEWLKELNGGDLKIVHLELDHEPLTTTPTFIVARPHWSKTIPSLMRQEAKGLPFNLVHLSDEGLADPLDLQGLTQCKKIVRNQPRPEVLCGTEKVFTLPLGQVKGDGAAGPPIKDRKQVWSFAGTGWCNRLEALEPLKEIVPNHVHTTPDWAHATQYGEKRYLELLEQSKFVACPSGNNAETFRFQEALKKGAIPLLVEDGKSPHFAGLVRKQMPSLMIFGSWTDVWLFLSEVKDAAEVLEGQRSLVLKEWGVWKERCKDEFRSLWCTKN